MRLIVEVQMRPTEDQEKIIKALTNLFDLDDIKVEDGGKYKKIVGVSEKVSSLKKFREKIWMQRILDTARSMMLRGASEESIIFMLHKQAAYAGKVSFIENENESSLGPIVVKIETKAPREIIDWLAPKTSEGKPLWIKDMPAEA